MQAQENVIVRFVRELRRRRVFRTAGLYVVGAWLGHAAVRQRRQRGEPASQWPLAALMIGMTVLALWSLGQNLVFVAETTPMGT